MPPGHIPSFLFATLIASFSYGIAVTLFAISIGTILRKRRSTGKINLPFVMPSALIFILATVNVIGLWINIHAAFVVHANDTEAYLDRIRTPAKTVIQTGQVGAIILADALIVYRTFVVWNHNIFIIIIPCLTFVATFVSGVSFVRLQHQLADVHTSVFAQSVTDWTVAFLLCSFVTTVYSTALITYKLLKTHRNLREYGVMTNDGVSYRIMRIVVESAALYSLNHLLYAILYEVKNQVESTPSFLEASIASITCSLIIIRCEKVSNSPKTLSTSNGSNPMKPPIKQLSFGKYSETKDSHVFTLHEMKGDSDVSTTANEEV